MDTNSMILSLFGGGLIGVAVTLMLLFNGRVTGISGILASSLAAQRKDELWRWFFLVGMMSGGALIYKIRPEFFINLSEVGPTAVIAAGLLVGYGTSMGSGCTSGHGVCGISRFSVRSILATMTFIFFGFLAVQGFGIYAGGLS